MPFWNRPRPATPGKIQLRKPCTNLAATALAHQGSCTSSSRIPTSRLRAILVATCLYDVRFEYLWPACGQCRAGSPVRSPRVPFQLWMVPLFPHSWQRHTMILPSASIAVSILPRHCFCPGRGQHVTLHIDDCSDAWVVGSTTSTARNSTKCFAGPHVGAIAPSLVRNLMKLLTSGSMVFVFLGTAFQIATLGQQFRVQADFKQVTNPGPCD